MNLVQVDEKECVHCGACTAVCNSKALELDKESCALFYNSKACVGCKNCIEVCPVRAISVGVYGWCSYA
ncbi:MAG: 4Fe-4S dicluster domain-containing protein [Lutispora sp.]